MNIQTAVIDAWKQRDLLVAQAWKDRDSIASSSWLAVISCAIVALGALFCFYLFDSRSGNGEPFAWFDGISAWPSIAIFIFAAFLSIHFILKTHFSEGLPGQGVGAYEAKETPSFHTSAKNPGSDRHYDRGGSLNASGRILLRLGTARDSRPTISVRRNRPCYIVAVSSAVAPPKTGPDRVIPLGSCLLAF